MDTIKEYSLICAATIVHGIITKLFLGSMPIVLPEEFNETFILAFSLWVIYTALLYFVMQVFVMKANNYLKQCIYAILFGIGAALFKILLDFILEKLAISMENVLMSSFMNGIDTCLFGILIMIFLFLVIGKQRLEIQKSKMEFPVIILLCLAGIHLIALFYNNYQMQGAIERYNATAEQINNLDFYVAFKMLDVNVIIYILFYPTLWWLLRRCTRSEKEQMNVRTKKRTYCFSIIYFSGNMFGLWKKELKDKLWKDST